MTTQHTPGPWSVEQIGALWIGRRRSAGGFEQIVTKIDFHGYSDEAKARKLADARLIASAPALLEALEMMIADFRDYPASERPCLAFDKARAAVASARGAA